ncbi:MAG: homocysteine S-methyltransferase family protein [Chloroflexota bacterium]|jgi:5-methyltetrahydrofolate--homocysteine methyltransferase
MSKLKDRLSLPGILVTDGATGTMLQNAGLPVGAPSELWVLENPDGVRALHRGYVEAGSDVILTDTFGGTRIKLESNHLGDKVVEINLNAARLAREIAGDKVFVFGDIGPTGKILEPLGALSYAEAVDAFAEQAGALVKGGVDAIIIETMSDLSEAKAAIEGVRKVTDLPLAVSMSFDTRGRTMMGVKPANAAKEFVALGVDIFGANCGRTLEETLTAIREMRQLFPDAVLWAKPNAGLPHMDGSDTVYDVTPEVMAEYALKFAGEGVKFFGGCCGSNPDHIRAIALTLHKPA